MTKDIKHTPGPWTFDPQGDYFAFAGSEQRPAANPDYDFRIEFSDHVSPQEQAATVQIISASTDLLGALKITMINVGAAGIATSTFEKMKAERWWIGAMTAIAKAEGRAEAD